MTNDNGEKMTRTGPDGWRVEAYDYARDVAAPLRSQMETVASTIIAEGRLRGTTIMRLRDHLGRLGAIPDLVPPDGIPAITAPLGIGA
ncbi:MAG: hypothetical protein ACREMM_13055 [Gemmatimonadales bacterium]